MSITLFSEINHSGTKTPFDPNGNAYLAKIADSIKVSSNMPDLRVAEPFPIQSVINNTEYALFIGTLQSSDIFIGSSNDLKLKDDVRLIRAVKLPINTYKITMIVFIVLFSFMFIGSLILYFTGMMKFHFSSVSFGHGEHY